MADKRWYSVFRSSVRSEATPCICHETHDKEFTLCGRRITDDATLEDDDNNLEPDCIMCRRALAKLMAQRAPVEESALLCADCSPGHTLGQLRKPCGTSGCECWCNRSTKAPRAARAKDKP